MQTISLIPAQRALWILEMAFLLVSFVLFSRRCWRLMVRESEK